MSSPNPATDDPPDNPGESQEPEDKITGTLESLWFGIVINAIGVILALLPPHWATAGIILAVIGLVFIFGGFVQAEHCKKFEPGTPEQNRARTTALTGLYYGCCVIAASILAATFPPHSLGPAITFAIMALLPVSAGIRLFFAPQVKRHVRKVLHRWPHASPAIAMTLFLLLYLSGAVFWGGTNHWYAPTSMVISIFSFILPLALAGSQGLRGISWARGIFAFSCLPLIILGLLGGHSAWLTITGNEPQVCQYADIEYSESRTNTTPIYQFECGDEIVKYDPQLSETVDIEDDKIILVTDSTGITEALLPSEVPGILGTLYLINLGITLPSYLLTVIPFRRKPRASA